MRSLGVAGMAAGARSLAAAGMARASRAGWRVLGVGIRGVGAAFKIAFGPMSLLLTALSFGVDYIIENWDKIVPYFKTLWEGVKSIFEKVKGWMQPALDMVGGAFEKVTAFWNWAFGDNEKKEEKPAPRPTLAESLPSQGSYEKYLKMEAADNEAMGEFDEESVAVPTLYEKSLEIEEPEEKPKKKRRKKKQSADQNGSPSGDAQAASVSVNMEFALNGMPAADFSNGVIKAIREKKAELENIISTIVRDQARLAYGG